MKKLLLLFLIPLSSIALELKPFETDGCTFFIEGTKRYNWSKCCLKHDIDYYFGGSIHRRRSVDQKLKQCVQKKAGKVLALIMRAGVGIGHLSPIKSKYAWNKAWNKSRKSFGDKFSKEELDLIYLRMSESEVDPSVWLPLFEQLMR